MPFEVIETIGRLGGLIIIGGMGLIGVRLWLGYKRERLRDGRPQDVERLSDAVEALHDQVHSLRDELGEVHERLDFAERLLTSGRDPQQRQPAAAPE
jgi:hypothetical protein